MAGSYIFLTILSLGFVRGHGVTIGVLVLEQIGFPLVRL